MLLLRRAATAVGLRPTRPFLPVPFTSAAAETRFFSVTTSTLDAADPKPSTSADPLPSTLWAPWQVSDLMRREIRYYKRYGPNYIDHLDEKAQEACRKGIESRKTVETIVKGELGAEKSHLWHEVLRETNKRHLVATRSVLEEFKRRRRELSPFIVGQETPEQRQLASDREEFARSDYRAKRREIRHQVTEEFLKRS